MSIQRNMYQTIKHLFFINIGTMKKIFKQNLIILCKLY